MRPKSCGRCGVSVRLRCGNVHEGLLPRHPLTYTTVMTRLTRKGLLCRSKVGRAYVCEPSVSPDGC